MSKYTRKYDPKARVLHVWPDRQQVTTAGGNVSQEDWDRIFAKEEPAESTTE